MFKNLIHLRNGYIAYDNRYSQKIEINTIDINNRTVTANDLTFGDLKEIPFNAVTLLENTYMRDKNGDFIYEGDYIKVEGILYQVKKYGDIDITNRNYWLSDEMFVICRGSTIDPYLQCFTQHENAIEFVAHGFEEDKSLFKKVYWED